MDISCVSKGVCKSLLSALQKLYLGHTICCRTPCSSRCFITIFANLSRNLKCAHWSKIFLKGKFQNAYLGEDGLPKKFIILLFAHCHVVPNPKSWKKHHFQWRDRNLLDLIKDILIYVLKMKEGLLGLYMRVSTWWQSLLGWTVPLMSVMT